MYKYKNFSASGLVQAGGGSAIGIIIHSNSSGTIKLWDNTSAAGTVFDNEMSLGATERFIPLFGKEYKVGLYVTIGGTADICIVYDPNVPINS